MIKIFFRNSNNINYLQCRNSLLELLSNVKVTVFGDSRFSLSRSGESKFALRHPCLLTRIFPHCGLFFPLRKAIALTCRRGNWTAERAASCWCHRKNITWDWERIFESGTFFFRNHQSIRVDYDGKNALDFFQQASFVFSTKNKYFWIGITCNSLLNN